MYVWILHFTCCTTVPWISIWRWSFQSNTSHVVYHSSQPSHCIMLSRHSGISQVQNTSISWYGNHGYGGTGARLCECGKGVSFCLVKHLAKCCRILSCSNSISSKLFPLAAWKAYAIAYTPQSAIPCCCGRFGTCTMIMGLSPHHLLLSKSSAYIWWLADTVKASQRTCCRILPDCHQH